MDAAHRISSSSLDKRRVGVAVALALAASLVINTAIFLVADALVTIPAAFTPLDLVSVSSLTIIGVLAAAAIRFGLERFADDPSRTFQRLVVVALPLTLIPDVVIWANGSYEGTASAETVLPLMAMHFVVAAICFATLSLPTNRAAPAIDE